MAILDFAFLFRRKEERRYSGVARRVRRFGGRVIEGEVRVVGREIGGCVVEGHGLIEANLRVGREIGKIDGENQKNL